MKPPMPYFGGKQRIADRITELFPPHQHYVEPYAGGLSVLLAKPPSKLETVNDLDDALVTFWRVLRDDPAGLERACALTPHARSEHRNSYTVMMADTDLETARRVWVQLSQGRTGTRLRTGWRFYIDPTGTNVGMPGYLDGYLKRIAPAAARLHNVSLECRPAPDVIRDYGSNPDVLLYVDPPYLGSERSRNSYLHEMHDEIDHRALAEALNECKASVALSGYRSDLYDDLYRDWTPHAIAASTQQSTSAERTEVVWCNYDMPTLFDLEAS